MPSRHALLAGVVLSVVGCSDRPFDMVKVEGAVLYSDGAEIPAARIVVTFHPQDAPANERRHPRPGQAVVRQSGGLFDVVTSHEYADGIVAGRHKVTVVAQDEDWRPARGLIPAKYASVATTPLSVDASDSPFKLLISRPAP